MSNRKYQERSVNPSLYEVDSVCEIRTQFNLSCRNCEYYKYCTNERRIKNGKKNFKRNQGTESKEV